MKTDRNPSRPLRWTSAPPRGSLPTPFGGGSARRKPFCGKTTCDARKDTRARRATPRADLDLDPLARASLQLPPTGDSLLESLLDEVLVVLVALVIDVAETLGGISVSLLVVANDGLKHQRGVLALRGGLSVRCAGRETSRGIGGQRNIKIRVPAPLPLSLLLLLLLLLLFLTVHLHVTEAKRKASVSDGSGRRRLLTKAGVDTGEIFLPRHGVGGFFY